MSLHFLLRAWVAGAVAGFAWADEPVANPDELPRIPPTPPAKALATFKIKPGFRLEMAASEPNVIDPVAMAFDEFGKLYVVEMIGYSERREEALDRIRLLEDRDRDGVFETSTVFAEGLKWPTGVACSRGGVYVAASPDLLFLKDADGDGKADVKEVAFTGFAKGNAKPNVQALPNGLTWGLDNRIHGATSMNGGELSSNDGAAVRVNGRDFSFDPLTRELRAEAGGGQNGLTFDDWGRKFVCHNSHHVQAIMHAGRYAEAAGGLMPSPLVDIATDGAAAEVFRLSGEEPWRVMRTRWRVAGLVGGPVEGGGRSSGYFTSATGICVFRGAGWPTEFAGNIFVADVGSNLVHRKILSSSDGVSLSASRPKGEEKTEFLASTDNWFRPVFLCNGPDGALYIADMYREVIEHPWSVPESIKKHLDLNSGNDRGRIYRALPEKAKPNAAVNLGKATMETLVKTLGHANAWHRETAARLLYERHDAQAVPLLTSLFCEAKSPLARVHALWALDGLKALGNDTMESALKDPTPEVRRQAVILGEARPGRHELLARHAEILAKDADASVRYQWALTLLRVPLSDPIPALRSILAKDHAHAWIAPAALAAGRDHAAKLLASFLDERDFLSQPTAGACLEPLARLAGLRQPSKELMARLRSLDSPRELAWLLTTAYLAGSKSSPEKPERLLEPADLKALAAETLPVALDAAAPEARRSAALKALAICCPAESLADLAKLLEASTPDRIRGEALATLAAVGHPRVGKLLLERWDSMTPELRTRALTALLSSPMWTLDLIEAMTRGDVPWRLLSAGQIAQLTGHADEQIRAKAVQLIKVAKDRAEVIQRYIPALALTGDAAKGKATYDQRCATCHSPAANGQTFGPDAKTFKTGGKERILTNFLDPNREVAPNFAAYLVETKGGQSYSGIVVREDENSLVLRMPGLDQTFSRAELASVKNQGQSSMAEGLEAGLSNQDLADLMTYLMDGDL